MLAAGEWELEGDACQGQDDENQDKEAAEDVKVGTGMRSCKGTTTAEPSMGRQQPAHGDGAHVPGSARELCTQARSSGGELGGLGLALPKAAALPLGSRGAGSAEGRSSGSCGLNAGASLPRADERLPVQAALDALRRLIPDRSRSEAQLQNPLREPGMLRGLCSEQPRFPGNRDKTMGLRGRRNEIK